MDGRVDILRFFSPELGRRDHTERMLTALGAHCLDPTSASLSLQMIPVQPSGQSQPSRPAKHVPPFLQSSQVRLQSWPKEWSRQTEGRWGERLQSSIPSLRPWAKEERARDILASKFQGEIWGPV